LVEGSKNEWIDCKAPVDDIKNNEASKDTSTNNYDKDAMVFHVVGERRTMEHTESRIRILFAFFLSLQHLLHGLW
jgi:hypothetical protein